MQSGLQIASVKLRRERKCEMRDDACSVSSVKILRTCPTVRPSACATV